MFASRLRMLRPLVPARNCFGFRRDSLVKNNPGTLIEASTLRSFIKNKVKNLCLVDTTWFMPNDERKGLKEYQTETIPNSIFFDIDKVADLSFPYPHMMPSTKEFTEHMKTMHIHKDDIIVCFDHVGVFSSPRAWFTFHTFGCPNVKVLNGGLKAWKEKKYPTSEGKLTQFPENNGSYEFVRNDSSILSMSEINALVPKIMSKEVAHYILDARAADRFGGLVKEPRPGIRSGCIKGSLNVPFKELLTDNSTRMKSVAELKEYFEKKGIDLSKPITASCGSGLTACVVLLALHTVGAKDLSIYDGSWTEYGSYPEPNL